MTEPEELVVDKARVAGLALAAAAAAWAFRARARARQRAEQLAAEERRAKWEAGASERERMRQEEDERRRQRHEEFLAAGKAKRRRYEIVGERHLDKRKKRFATELDARICTWVQHEKHGSSLQRAYRCDGRDGGDSSGPRCPQCRGPLRLEDQSDGMHVCDACTGAVYFAEGDGKIFDAMTHRSRVYERHKATGAFDRPVIYDFYEDRQKTRTAPTSRGITSEADR